MRQYGQDVIIANVQNIKCAQPVDEPGSSYGKWIVANWCYLD